MDKRTFSKKKSDLEEKLQVVFHEYNILGNNSIYLPLVSGSLQANSEMNPLIKEKYDFKPFFFYRDNPDNIITKLDKPSVSAFSVSMWNANLSLEVARITKELFPNSLIILGGPHVPVQEKNLERFFLKNPFVDITVRSDGESPFSKILERFLETREEKDFRDINGIGYKTGNGKFFFNKNQKLEKNLDIFPTPYKEGGPFDKLLSESNMNFHAILETNRGCPFRCSYCFWGEGDMQSKMRWFSLERVKQAVDWIGRNKIEYVYGADANFGMFERDAEIAQIFVDTKRKYGYPHYFRVCYGKNRTDRVFKVAKILSEADMAKGVTLSRQSNDIETLKNVRRQNINLNTYDKLQERYSKNDISTYTEMILGLPGETYNSFLNGLEGILKASRVDQLYVYLCQVLPNTQLADSQYKSEHGIVTKIAPLQEIHGVKRLNDLVEEDEELVVSTNSMPPEDWRKSTVNSWVAQIMHSLKMGYNISNYLWGEHGIRYTSFYEHLAQKIISGYTPLITNEVNNLHNLAKKIQEGNPRAQVVPEFGESTWEPEEASFLRFIKEAPIFYRELSSITIDYLKDYGREFDQEEIEEVFKYQKALTPSWPTSKQIIFNFEHNIPEYMSHFFDNDRPKIHREKQVLKIIKNRDFGDDSSEYAKETVLWGRRSNEVLYNSTWSKF